MKLTRARARAWERLGQRATFFGVAVPELARSRSDMMVLTADLAQLSNLNRFAEQYPEQFLNVGIAEQNMIGIAAGLAMEGHLVYATTYASFLTARDLEFVRQHLSNLHLNVKLVGTAAGVVAARSGVAHWACEDLAWMRTLPGMTVLNAADSIQACAMALYSAETEGPMYIRLNGAPNSPLVYDERYVFCPEKIDILEQGNDVALIGTGLMVHEARKAAALLRERSISCTVANLHTIKPLDTQTLEELFSSHALVVSVEEHSVLGGMGGAVAEHRAGMKTAAPQLLLGFPDAYLTGGTPGYIWEQFGLTAPQIAERVERALREGLPS